MGNGGGVVSGASGASRNAESSAEKKSVIFPSQFHEIAAVSEEVQIPDAGKSRRNALCLLRRSPSRVTSCSVGSTYRLIVAYLAGSGPGPAR